MTPTQIRMARAGLGWTVDRLAEAAGIHRMTVLRFEKGATISAEALAAIRQAVEDAGAQLISRGGRVGATVPQD